MLDGGRRRRAPASFLLLRRSVRHQRRHDQGKRCGAKKMGVSHLSRSKKKNLKAP
jgi:hypothetical protein